ncbi:MAG: PAS domain S-box protein, partial [Alphaproteobacteria bacterium]|nr:PAS domain S-box protein [Alphaproteobacteria bacterium]
MRASEARLAGMISIAPEAIIAVNEKFRISIFNQGAEKIFGYQASEVLGQPLDLLVPARFRNRHRSHMDEFQNSPEESRSMTERGGITGLRKDGVE